MSVSGMDLQGIIYCRFPLTHEIIYGELSITEHVNL